MGWGGDSERSWGRKREEEVGGRGGMGGGREVQSSVSMHTRFTNSKLCKIKYSSSQHFPVKKNPNQKPWEMRVSEDCFLFHFVPA